MIRWNHRGGEPTQQLSITLLAGHHQHLFQRQIPAQRQVSNRLAAGRQTGQHIEEPMAAQLGPRLHPLPAQALTHQIQDRGVRLPQQVTHLPRSLLFIRLEREVILQILHGVLHRFPAPVSTDVLLPGAIGHQSLPEMNLRAGPADPHLGRRQMQLAVALPCHSQRSTRENPKPVATTIAFELPAKRSQALVLRQIQVAVEIKQKQVIRLSNGG